ncbi:MAG: hypothetical protein QNJ07_11565 [Woeseiaceae bacterium]|nr:hypothetical protein [Woeseiaceae bacterium]
MNAQVEFQHRDERISVEGVMESIRNFATLSEALRILGATVLLASMSLFLLQGWNDGNDISRYLLLLAQTGLLAAGGFALSHGLKETRGARIFFGLALVSVPANFTILGALLYSVFQWDGGLTTYPGYAEWRIEDVANIGITLGGAMLVLVPVTLFCFAIMARHSAKTLSLHFIALNALLLLPIRSSMAAGTIALIGTVYALYVIGRQVGRDRALNTGEGKFALTTLFIPIGIILFRSMYFYQVDSLMVAMLSLAVFMAMRQASLFPGRAPRMAQALEALSLLIALVVATSITNAFAPSIAYALLAPLFSVSYAMLAMDVLRRTDSRFLKGTAASTTSLFVSLSFILSVSLEPSGWTALLALLAGATLMLAGMAFRSRTATVAGSFTVLAGGVFGFEEIVKLVVASSWIDLAIFGACAIALGSVLDRHGVPLKLRLTKWMESFSEEKQEIALND